MLMKPKKLLLIILALTAYTFHRAFFANYVLWDDDALIFNNVMLKMPFWEALKTASTSYYHGDFFPLTLTSYWIDHALFGMNAAAQHGINWLMHLISVALLFLFLQKFSQHKILILFATLAYALHPLQAETVMWISERKSLLSSMLTFASLWMYLKSYDNVRPRLYYWGAWLCFVLACLAKATTVLLPVLFVAMDIVRSKKSPQAIGMRLLPMAITAGFLSQLRVAAYAASVGYVTNTMWDLERLKNVPAMALNALGFYVGKFFWPFDMSAMYSNFIMTDQVIVVSILVVIGLCYILWKIIKTKDQELIFFTLWFLLFLAPVLQIIPRINYVNDRYMYLPIVGFVGMLLRTDFLRVIQKIPERFNKTYMVAAVALFWAFISFQQSQVWETNRLLWQNVIRVFPESAIAHNNLGLDYQKMEEFDRAIFHFNLILEKAAEEQNRLLAFNNLANIYANSKFSGYNPQISLNLLNQGIRRAKYVRDTYELRINLAVNLMKLGRMQEGMANLNSLLKDLSNEPDYRFNWLREMAQGIAAQVRTLPPAMTAPINTIK